MKIKATTWLGFALVAIVASAMFLHSNLSRRAAQQHIADVFPANLKDVLDKSQSFEMLSLYPYPPTSFDDEKGGQYEEYEPQYQRLPRFHGFPILGKIVLKDSATRKHVLESLYQGVGEMTNDDDVAACFLPRHGIRTTRNGQSVDLVICFGCKQIHIYNAGKKTGTYVSRSPQETFNQVLRASNIPITPDSHKSSTE